MTDPRQEFRDVLRQLASEDAPALLERARSRARERAERLIEDTLVEELIEAAAALRAADAPKGTSDAQARPLGATAPKTGDAWWTYCILWNQEAVSAATGIEGIEPGSRVEAACDGDLAALVSPVPLADYGDERLREHLEDLEWVERIARRHEEVLEAALNETTIVPLRLCTLYHDLDGVRRLLRENGTALREGLRRVEGCIEWGLKVFADPQSPKADATPEPVGSEGRGATYLLRRQQERVLAEKATEVRARCVEVVHQRVAALARASTTNPPQRPEIHGRELAMLLNGAYLIERDRAAELQETVGALQEEWTALGFTIELTGPWPPYNFVSGAAGGLS